MARRNSIQLLVMVAAALAYLALVIFAAPAAHATVYTWDNNATGFAWGTAGNWGPAHTAVPGAYDTAKFQDTGAGTVTMGSGQSVSGIIFDNPTSLTPSAGPDSP